MATEGQEIPLTKQQLSSNPSHPLWSRLRSLWRKTPQTPQTLSTQPETKPVEQSSIDTGVSIISNAIRIDLDKHEPALPLRKTGAGEAFINRLKASGITLETPDFEKVGVAAQGGTNEQGDPALFEKIRSQEQAPNGYLIGIGAANVFSMLETFSKGNIPRAILLFDVDPAVIAEGRRIIQDLKNEPETSNQKDGSGKTVINPNWTCDYKAAMEKYRPKLKQLAKEGNLVIARADFTDPRLINELANLPDIKRLNNVVYLSNIADHLHRRQSLEAQTTFLPDFSFLAALQPESPYRNYYIDTLQRNLDYKLRIGLHPPRFSKYDFSSLLNVRIQTLPIDEIDPLPENPVWEDISQWDLDKLINTYRQLSTASTQQQRKDYIGQRIEEGRSDTLSHYDEYKTKAQQPPEEQLPKLYQRYVVPTDSSEEQALLSELSQPYDYNNDFIPFLAHNLWLNADFPWQILFHSLPKRNNYKINHETGERTLITDPRDCLKGRVEIPWLEAGIPFEELAMAKIYREIEKRALRAKPELHP